MSIIALISTLALAVIPPATGDLNPLSNTQKALRPCVNMLELDCIETLTVQYPNGKSSGLKLIQPATGSFLDEYGQTIENSGSVWTYVDLNGISRKLVITASLNGENYISPVYKKRYPAMWITFLDIDSSEINSGTKFKLTLKTSWLKPQGVGLAGANATFTAQDLATGSRYTFVASPFLSTSLNSPEKYALLNSVGQEATISDGERPVLNFVIDHWSSVAGGTFWDPSCAEFGYSVTSHNAIGAGQPFMSDNETLKFNIGAPHRLSTGELTKGFFTTDIPLAYLDCKWPGNVLTKSPRVEISIVNTDGTTQVATTTVKIEKQILKVRAFGFHYSSPTIVLRASNDLLLPSLVGNVDETNAAIADKAAADIVVADKAVADKAAADKAAADKAAADKAVADKAAADKDAVIKKKTITCIKGKLTKKVSGLSPKCPAGYKKK